MTWDDRGSTLGTRDLDVIPFLRAGQVYSVHIGLLQPQKQLQLVAYRGPLLLVRTVQVKSWSVRTPGDVPSPRPVLSFPLAPL